MEPMNLTLASEDCNLYTYDMRRLQSALCVHKVFHPVLAFHFLTAAAGIVSDYASPGCKHALATSRAFLCTGSKKRVFYMDLYGRG